jgi:Big-like domain-containing protein
VRGLLVGAIDGADRVSMFAYDVGGLRVVSSERITTSYDDIESLAWPESCTSDAPSAANDAYSVDEDKRLASPAPGVLANDLDPNDDPLTAALVSGPLHGTLVFTPDGSFSYIPTPTTFSRTDIFSYTVSDGTLTSNIATVTVTVNPLPVVVPDVIGSGLPTATK